jgi:hypothetical protein
VQCCCALIEVVLGDKYFEQRIGAKYLLRLGKEPTEVSGTLKQVYVYGKEVISRVPVLEWHKQFSKQRDKAEFDS